MREVAQQAEQLGREGACSSTRRSGQYDFVTVIEAADNVTVRKVGASSAQPGHDAHR